MSTPDRTLLLPSRLTAENGAKAALIGEFHETIDLPCHECGTDDDLRDDCEFCGGHGEYSQDVPVSWTTTKEIYAAAVAHFERHAKGEG